MSNIAKVSCKHFTDALPVLQGYVISSPPMKTQHYDWTKEGTEFFPILNK